MGELQVKMCFTKHNENWLKLVAKKCKQPVTFCTSTQEWSISSIICTVCKESSGLTRKQVWMFFPRIPFRWMQDNQDERCSFNWSANSSHSLASKLAGCIKKPPFANYSKPVERVQRHILGDLWAQSQLVIHTYDRAGLKFEMTCAIWHIILESNL